VGLKESGRFECLGSSKFLCTTSAREKLQKLDTMGGAVAENKRGLRGREGGSRLGQRKREERRVPGPVRVTCGA